jgi:hypothetical protein
MSSNNIKCNTTLKAKNSVLILKKISRSQVFLAMEATVVLEASFWPNGIQRPSLARRPLSGTSGMHRRRRRSMACRRIMARRWSSGRQGLRMRRSSAQGRSPTRSLWIRTRFRAVAPTKQQQHSIEESRVRAEAAEEGERQILLSLSIGPQNQ